MFDIKKSAILAAMLAGVISIGSFVDAAATPMNSVTSTTMKNSSIRDFAE